MGADPERPPLGPFLLLLLFAVLVKGPPAAVVAEADAAAPPVLVVLAVAAVEVLPVAAAAHSCHNQGIHNSFARLSLVHWVHCSHNLHNPAVGIHSSCFRYTGCWHLAGAPKGINSG